MRRIGQLSNQINATRFSGFLLGQGISNVVEREGENWVVWVHSEDDLERAKRFLRGFLGNPHHPHFRPSAATSFEHRSRLDDSSSGQMLNSGDASAGGKSDLTETLATIGIGPLTFALVLGSLAVGIVSGFGGNVAMLQPLFTTQFTVQGEYATWVQGLAEIRSGQVWRIVSPVLVHFGVLHLLFNMLWFVVMASMVESRERSGKLLFLILTIGGISNLAEYSLTGPYFGGMSGVLYGLLGYIWMKVRLDPLSGYFLGMNTVTLLMVWFFICLLGVIPNVANIAHVFGLLSGFAIGFVCSVRANHRR